MCFALNSVLLLIYIAIITSKCQTYITQVKIRNIYYTSQNAEHILHKSKCRTYIHTMSSSMYNLHLFFIALQAAYGILLPALGPLHRGIHRFPLELLVRGPLVEDGPASIRFNLKKGSIYQNRTDGNKIMKRPNPVTVESLCLQC